MFTPHSAGQARITLTLADSENQKVTLFVDEIISVERCPGDIFITRIHCKSNMDYLVVESIDEVTMQLEIQLMAYS